MEKWNSFEEVCLYIQNLPYKRNVNKENIFCVIEDQGGTCSTKHAFLKYYADENDIVGVQLMLGIFMMNSKNTPKIASILQQYQLEEIPEAHNYLKIIDLTCDFTRKNSHPTDFVEDLVEEIEINISQISYFKIQYHQEFLKRYLEQNPQIPYSLITFWRIREECIAALQQ